MPALLLREIQCRCCKLVFFICRRCFRGQAYCSDACRLFGRLKNHRQAQRRYRQTEKGKKAHREAENRRRYGLTQKKMDDLSSTSLPARCINPITAVKNRLWIMGATVRCHFCGSLGHLVDQFPRRGYG